MTTIEIQNLKCGGCANTVTKGVLSISGTSEVSVNLKTSTVSFEALSDTVINEVKIKLSKLGYPETDATNTMIHKAKSFVSCAAGRLTEEV
jgi:copper chaperone CopZ